MQSHPTCLRLQYSIDQFSAKNVLFYHVVNLVNPPLFFNFFFMFLAGGSSTELDSDNAAPVP